MPDLEHTKAQNPDKGETLLKRSQSPKLLQDLKDLEQVMDHPAFLKTASAETLARVCFQRILEKPTPLLTVDAAEKTRALTQNPAATPEVKQAAAKILKTHEKNVLHHLEILEHVIMRSLLTTTPQEPPQHEVLTRILDYKIPPGKQPDQRENAILLGIHPDVEEILKKYPGREIMLERARTPRLEGERHIRDYKERLRSYSPEQADTVVKLAQVIAFQTPGAHREGNPNHFLIRSEGESIHLFQETKEGRTPILKEEAEEKLKKLASREETPELTRSLIRKIISNNINLK